MWHNLIRWVEQNGGFVHHNLEVRTVDLCNNAAPHRGLFLSNYTVPIRPGEILIRLPRSTATISGQDLPPTYVDSEGNADSLPITVSSWLRCIAALMIALESCNGKKMDHDIEPNIDCKREQRDVSPYIFSLPTSYETMWHWTAQEVEEYLVGTKPSGVEGVHTDTQSNAWMIDPLVIRRQYDNFVRPYLQHCGAITTTVSGNDVECCFDRFKLACQILSTRGFFMNHSSAQRSSMEIFHENGRTNEYNGPYLLPVIDLINHADLGSVGVNATLELLHQQDAFVIRAIGDITPDTEILHSYGDHLSSYQFLLSFGFVPLNRIQRAITLKDSVESFVGSVVITKQRVWESCWDVIESGLPQKLATIIEQSSLEDETWSVVVDRSRTSNAIPNDIVIALSSDGNNGSTNVYADILLSDELVTAACIPFLPSCAFAEIGSGGLLDRTILQDYFLGQLVGAALVRTIQDRIATYTLVPVATVQRLLPTFGSPKGDEKSVDDVSLLSAIVRMLNGQSAGGATAYACNPAICRLAYGLTIRIEEKTTLEALMKLVVFELNNLENDISIDFDGGDDEAHSKKPKRTMD